MSIHVACNALVPSGAGLIHGTVVWLGPGKSVRMNVGWKGVVTFGVADCSSCTLDMPNGVHSVGRRGRTTL